MLRGYSPEKIILGYGSFQRQTSSWDLRGVCGEILLSLSYFHYWAPIIHSSQSLGYEFFRGESKISQLWSSNHNGHTLNYSGGFSIDLRSHWKKGRMLSSTPAFPKQILSFFGQFNTSNIVYPCSRYWAKVCKDVRCKTFLTPFISVVFFIDDLVSHFDIVEFLVSLCSALRSYC